MLGSRLGCVVMCFAVYSQTWAQVVQMANVNSAGQPGNHGSNIASMSADGRFIAFKSDATNLVPAGQSGNVYVRDLQSGTTTGLGVMAGDDVVSISNDGRVVGFASPFSTVVPLDTNGVADAFVFDRQSGITTRVSVSSAGIQGNYRSNSPSLSGDGRYAVFTSDATNLVPNDTNGWADAFLRDVPAGTTTLLSTGIGGVGADANIEWAVMSNDGRYVVFSSKASNLVPGDTNGATDVFVRDVQSGITLRVSVDSQGIQSNGSSDSGAVSLDGRYIVFESSASNLVPGDTNGRWDTFVHDQQNATTILVSRSSGGQIGDSDSQSGSISADGRFVVFSSRAGNLVHNDIPGEYQDIFVRDLQVGTTTRLSVDSVGWRGNYHSYFPWITADGRFVAFWSFASNLVPNDTNGWYDAFLCDRVATPPSARVCMSDASTYTIGFPGVSFSGITSGDLDGDGDIDMAVSDKVWGRVWVSKNVGDGTFGPHVEYSVGGYQGDLIAKDMNADGDLDLIIAAPCGIEILWNDGQGNFALPPSCSLTGGIGLIDVQDFDGDGDLDVVGLTNTSDINYVSMFLNQGNATFVLQAAYPIANHPTSLTSADFDADGDRDVVVATIANGCVSVFMNQGNASLANSVNYPVSPGPYSVRSADLDNDGDADLVTVAHNSNSMTLLFNQGSGSFGSRVDLVLPSSTPSCVLASDFDDDGFVDLLVGYQSTFPLSLFFNRGDGTFDTPEQHALYVSGNQLLNADFDGDGDVDLASMWTYGVSVVIQCSAQAFSTSCFGDGTGVPCPCSNPGHPGRGCDNTASTGGARLKCIGKAGISSDTLKLNASSAVPFGPGLYFQGSAVFSMSGPFGNGLLCAGGAVQRIQVAFGDSTGRSSTTLPLHSFGPNQAGDSRYYQLWYRDGGSVGTCAPGFGFNLSNMIGLTWAP